MHTPHTEHASVPPRDTTPPPLHTPRERSFFSEALRFGIIALAIVIPIRIFVAQPFVVSGSSMDPTFEDGEYLIVDEISYRFEEPERGEVIIFRFPQEPSKFFIKRIVGLPGETVVVAENSVRIINDTQPEGFMLDEPYLTTNTAGRVRTELGVGEFFVLGDNRPASSDSRSWGALPERFIIGRALVRLLPIGKLDIFPGLPVAM